MHVCMSTMEIRDIWARENNSLFKKKKKKEFFVGTTRSTTRIPWSNESSWNFSVQVAGCAPYMGENTAIFSPFIYRREAAALLLSYKDGEKALLLLDRLERLLGSCPKLWEYKCLSLRTR